MNSKLQWIVPCYFNTNDSSDEIIIDITSEVKKFVSKFSNCVPDRYFNPILADLDASNICGVEVKILTRFISGYIDEKRIEKFIEVNAGSAVKILRDKTYKSWHWSNGSVIITVNFKTRYYNLPTKNQVKDYHYDNIFMAQYHQGRALLDEISKFFLSGLHLTFPTTSIMGWNDSPLNDGIIRLSGSRKNFYSYFNTENYMHHVLISIDRLDALKENLKGISTIWHLNLFALRRYLIAVKSNLIDMDSLLDLVYSLEALFEKNASAEFIKLFCCVSLCKTKNQAQILKKKLDLVYRLRNEMTHAGQYFSGNNTRKINAKDISDEDLFWEMKTILSLMLCLAISKLLKNTEMKNLVFNTEDFFDNYFAKR